MIFIQEDVDNIKHYLKQNYFIDIDEEINDVQLYKGKIFNSTLYRDAREHLYQGTICKYRRIINNCGSNRKKYIKDCVLSLATSLYKKKQQGS